MSFVRITLSRPRPEVRAEVEQHFQDLISSSARLPGFVAGYVLVSPDLSAEVGRVTIWDSQASANHAANDPHIMAVHAELNFDDRGTTQDWNLDSTFAITRPAGG